MRFKEFNKINEAKAENSVGYYTVGDSHAVGLANYAGKPWINKGKNGTKSDESLHYQALDSIPKGSVVLISAGANDTFAKRPPNATADSVSRLVNKATANGLNVVYLLFPVGTRENKWLRELTRDEIKKSLSVPIIDLEGSQLVDGVHADAAGYIKASKEALGKEKPSTNLGRSSSPGSVPAKDKKINVKLLKQGPPYPIELRDEVKQVQTSLEKLGYNVGRTGRDGRYGPFTATAVAAFKKDYKLPGNGSRFGEDEFSMLDKIESGLVAKVENPTKSNRSGLNLDIPALTSVENVQKAKEVAEDFLGRKMNDDEWKHLIQTTSAESTADPQELAQVAAVILNRTREQFGGKTTIVDVVWAPGQFQPVTGSYVKGKGWSGPNSNFTTPVGPDRLAKIIDAFMNNLPDSDRTYMYFTSANPKAYKTRRGLNFMKSMIASGGIKIGGTIFGNMQTDLARQNIASKKVPPGQSAKPTDKSNK